MDVTTRRVYVAIDVNVNIHVSDRDLSYGLTEVLVGALDKRGAPMTSQYLEALYRHTGQGEVYYVNLEVLPMPKTIRVLEV
jgi:hypothetical protein